MSQSNMLKEDILKILSKSVSGGSNTRPTYKSAKQPLTFFGGENQPYYPSAQEPNPAANPMKPIVPGIIRDKDPSKRPTYKSAKQPLTFFGGETECAKAKKLVKEKCGKTKRAPSAYNLFIKKYFAENSNASMKSAAAAWKLSKPSTKAAPKDRPKIALTSFGDVPPPPDTPAPKKKKLIIKKKAVLEPPAAFVEDIRKTPSPLKKKVAVAAPKKSVAPPKQRRSSTQDFVDKIPAADFKESIDEDAQEYYILLQETGAGASYGISKDQMKKARKMKKLVNAFFKTKETPKFNKYFKSLLEKDSVKELYDENDYEMSNRATENVVIQFGDFEEPLDEINIDMFIATARRYEREAPAAPKKKSAAKKPKQQPVAPTEPSLADELRSAAIDAEFGGNIRNTGKPLPKKQLKSASGKANKTKKNTTWLTHVAEFRKSNPSIKNRDVMREAKKTYNKSGGELLLTNSGGAEVVVDNNKIETHTMPDGSVMTGKTHSKISELVKQKKAGNVPEAPDKQDKKSDDDQSKIMVDIMNSFDVFNNRFGAISNSAGTIEEKKTQYSNERAKLEKYHQDIIKNYKEVLSSSNMEIATKAYNYAAETYKIGVENLTAGVPTQRVDFENFDDNDTITEIIDRSLARPRGAMDRAKSFYSVPIPRAKIQNFSPKVPSLGNMASIYPYGRQQAEKMIMGGRVKKDPKKLITELTKDLFIRDMTKKYPRRSLKEIKSAYQKYKKDIESIMTDAIVDSMKIRGGADCAANQYSSGDRCYNKQERPDNFDRTKFDAEQKRQAAANERRDDGMVKMPDPIATTKLDTTTRSFASPANPMPAPKPQPKNQKDFVSKFSAAITPPDSGAVFGTDASDISDPRAWVDSIANIAMGTFKGVESIFSALGDIF